MAIKDEDAKQRGESWRQTVKRVKVGETKSETEEESWYRRSEVRRTKRERQK